MIGTRIAMNPTRGSGTRLTFEQHACRSRGMAAGPNAKPTSDCYSTTQGNEATQVDSVHIPP